MELRGIDCRHRFVAQGSNKKTELGIFVDPPPSVDSAASLGGAVETGLTVVEVEFLLVETELTVVEVGFLLVEPQFEG